MTDYYNGECVTAMDRWDRILNQLSAEPRRMILASLMEVTEERRLPLPDAAMAANFDITSERLTIELHHHHLPMLADAGYIRWEDDPFCVQRGPKFEEVEPVMEMIFDSVDQLPEELIDGCQKLEQSVGAP